MRSGRVAGEERLLRLAMLWMTALSAAAARPTFAAAPVDVPPRFANAYMGVVLLIFLALWQRWVNASVATGLAVVVAGGASLHVFNPVIEAVLAGDLSTDAAAGVILPGIVAVSGLAFIGLSTRHALFLSLSFVAGHVVVVFASAGSQATAFLSERAIAQSLNFAVTAIGLFFVVTVLSSARASERDAAEREQERLRARAREMEVKEAIREQLQQEAAHELKGPLSMVKGAAETLEVRSDRMSEEQVAAIHAVLRHGVDRLSERVMKLATRDPLGTMEPGTPTLAVDALRSALQATADEFQPEHLDLSAADDCLIFVPQPALEHVLENLLSNARKYGDPDSPVSVIARDDDGLLVVRVVSRGGHLTKADERRVFDRHYRGTEHDPDVEGTGVGLALVRRLVTEWGGNVWCEVGQLTTTFGFTVPRTTRTEQVGVSANA